MNNTYPSIIPTDQESGSSGESLRIFDSSYNTYSPHSTPYPDYTTPSKLEAFDYNYWPTSTTTTHNILANPTNPVLDQIQTPSSTIESLVPIHLSHINSATTISSTHHHHHIHQHLYPPSSPTCTDPSTWLGSGDYQSLHSTTNPAYRHYSTPCSFYPPNNFYDPSQAQWTPPPPALPIKFESPYSPPPSYFESSDSINHCQEPISKDEPSDSHQQLHWLKPSSSSTQLIPIPPKNPLNGNQLTFK
jgi:hypothetical protein